MIRPVFADLAGQQRVITTLTEQVDQGDLPVGGVRVVRCGDLGHAGLSRVANE